MNKECFNSSCPMQILLIPFSYLCKLVRTSSIMLNGSDERKCPCTVPDFRDKTVRLLL